MPENQTDGLRATRRNGPPGQPTPMRRQQRRGVKVRTEYVSARNRISPPVIVGAVVVAVAMAGLFVLLMNL